MTTGVYQIVNEVNGKKYIGSSINIENRYKTHLSNLRNNKHPNKKLQNAANRYGLNKFYLQILEICEPDELLTIEQDHIDSADKDTLYNLTFIANSGGYDTLEVPVLLLDLNGSIVDIFKSQMQLSRVTGICVRSGKLLNTSSISKSMYRIVTTDFYLNNFEEIISWKTYANLAKELARMSSIEEEL